MYIESRLFIGIRTLWQRFLPSRHIRYVSSRYLKIQPNYRLSLNFLGSITCGTAVNLRSYLVLRSGIKRLFEATNQDNAHAHK